MPTPAQDAAIARLHAARRLHGQRKLDQVRATLTELEHRARPFTLASLAREAGVSRGFLYAHREVVAEARVVQLRVALTALGGSGTAHPPAAGPLHGPDA